MGETEPDNGRSQAAPPALPVPFLKRVKIRNYKSIAYCDVELGAFTVLVGRNGAGKSNFLDALKFVADALQPGASLGHAIRSRGGFQEVCARRCEDPKYFEIEIEFEITAGVFSTYSFRVRNKDVDGFLVEREHLEEKLGSERRVSFTKKCDKIVAYFYIGSKTTDSHFSFPQNNFVLGENMPALRAHSASREYCQGLRIHNLHPQLMRDAHIPGDGKVLQHDGSNVASVFGRIERERPEIKDRILGYLSAIVPGISDVKYIRHGPFESLEFTQTQPGSSSPSVFYPLNMSDGTLRAFGALVAVAQLAEGDNPVSLVGIEEPEAALHPAASGALMDALHEAAVHTQVVVTTHSPDLLDQLDLKTDRLLVVQMRDGVTEIGEVDPASREAIKEHLYTPGELLRMDQLQPDPTDLQRQRQELARGDAETPQ